MHRKTGNYSITIAHLVKDDVPAKDDVLVKDGDHDKTPNTSTLTIDVSNFDEYKLHLHTTDSDIQIKESNINNSKISTNLLLREIDNANTGDLVTY